jgi:glycosyltransferase involved in cell wall biosynthesis
MDSISIVIPAFNEEANVKETLQEVAAVIRGLGLEAEIILVNDGSQDCTGEIACQMIDEIPYLHVIENQPNLGYGGALKTGFAAARNDLIAFFPADRQFRFQEIQKWMAISPEADIVCGYRQKRQDAFMRRMNAWGWNLLVQALFGYLSRDVDCGFKLFHRRMLSKVCLFSDGAMIDTEFLASARARGLSKVEVPVTHLPRPNGISTGANPRVILKAFADLIQFRMRLNQVLKSCEGMPLQPVPIAVQPIEAKRHKDRYQRS